jgi:hypothetical protein
MGPWSGDHGNKIATIAKFSDKMLQWGRGLVTTEIPSGDSTDPSLLHASMGPWSGDHGNSIRQDPGFVRLCQIECESLFKRRVCSVTDRYSQIHG